MYRISFQDQQHLPRHPDTWRALFKGSEVDGRNRLQQQNNNFNITFCMLWRVRIESKRSCPPCCHEMWSEIQYFSLRRQRTFTTTKTTTTVANIINSLFDRSFARILTGWSIFLWVLQIWKWQSLEFEVPHAKHFVGFINKIDQICIS